MLVNAGGSVGVGHGDRQYSTNVLATLLVTQEAVKLFGKKGGSIINIGTAGTPNHSPAVVLYHAGLGQGAWG